MDSDEKEEKQRLCEAVAEGMYAVDRTAQRLGIVIEEVRPGFARGRMTVSDEMLNSHGTCHGGMLFTFADTIFAYACNSENKGTVALSCTIDYARPAKAGENLIAVGQRNIRNYKTGVYDITVTTVSGETICLFRGGSYQLSVESVPGLNKRLGIASA